VVISITNGILKKNKNKLKILTLDGVLERKHVNPLSVFAVFTIVDDHNIAEVDLSESMAVVRLAVYCPGGSIAVSREILLAGTNQGENGWWER